MKKIAVIGAGITGVTTAYALQNRGFDVALFDRCRYPAMETSFANGGQLSASNAEVWNSIGTVLKGLKWMLSSDAPLLVSPAPSWRKYSWMAEFMANIPNYRKHTVETVRLALAARGALTEMAERAGVDFDRQNRGILHFYADKRSFDQATRVNKLLAEGGLDRRAVTPEEMRAIEPSLGGALYGGYYTESDFTGDIHAFVRGVARYCEERGAQMRLGVDVEEARAEEGGVRISWRETSDGQERHDERYDGVVVCAGVASRDFAAGLGDRVPIYPVKGYSITVQMRDEDSRAAAPWVSLLDDDAKIVTSRLGADRFRIAGTAEINGYNKDIRADRIRPLVRWCERYFPGVCTEHVVPWAGLRPMMPSMMPKVGQGRHAGVFYNTGHGHLGWTLSAATAELVAEQVAVSVQDKVVALGSRPTVAASAADLAA